MRPDEIRRLLGGYATGTLTDTERGLLFTAALEEQSLFDALADEEALRELLADSQTRQELLAELKKPQVEAARPWERLTPELAARNVAAPAAPALSSVPPSALRPAGQPVTAASKNVWIWLAQTLTPRRMAIAGAFAALVLVIGGVQYLRRNNAEGTVELALNRPPVSVAQPSQAPAEQPQPAQAKSATVPQDTGSFARPRAAEGSLAEKSTSKEASARRDAEPAATAAAQPPPTKLEPSPLVERDKQIADERRAAQPVVDGRQQVGGLGGTADLEKKSEELRAAASASQQATVAREEPGRIARNEASPAGAPPPPPVASPAPAKERIQLGQEKAKVAADQTAANQGATNQTAVNLPLNSRATAKKAAPKAAAGQTLAGGPAGFRQAPPVPPTAAQRAAPPSDRLRQKNAAVSDINGTIVSINVGTNAGLKSGDTVEIVRADRVIGTVRLTEAGATFAVGPFAATPGMTDVPRTGDIVRSAPVRQQTNPQ